MMTPRTRRCIGPAADALPEATRVTFLMVFAIGVVLSAGFYAVGLHYWLLVGGFVSLVEIIPVIGPLVGALLVVVVGLPQSLQVIALALLVVVGLRTVQS